MAEKTYVKALHRFAAGKGAVFLLLCSLSTSPPSRAETLDFVEHLFGPTNINGFVGNGRLTAAFSARGELTVLRWPSTTHFNQLNYKTAIVPEGVGYGARDLPRMGAAENMGSFAGVDVATPAGRGTSWFRDDAWTHEQNYAPGDVPILVTSSWNATLGIGVTARAFVTPEADLLVQTFELRRSASSPVTSARFLFYENLSPCLTKTPFVPLADWNNEPWTDFAALYDPSRQAVLHFRPEGGDLSLLDPSFAPGAAPLDPTKLPQGVYFAVGGEAGPDGHQVGEDATTPCPAGRARNWPSQPRDAYLDAEAGTLSGGSLAGCQANAALSWPALGPSAGSATLTVFWSVGRSASESWALLAQARARGAASLLAETSGHWTRWLGGARLPRTQDPSVLRIARRSLVTLALLFDGATGALAVSPSTQPPYALDWPRDGAFANLALDVAGLTGLVSRHNRFYASVQRRAREMTPLGPAPAGSWGMNFYSDGMEGGPIPFELDEAGLALWTLADHVKYLPADERCPYLASVYPAIQRAADLFVDCRDAATGLPCMATVDDSVEYTQSLQGAASVALGLERAVEAGAAMGENPARLERWRSRLDELRSAVARNFYRPDLRRFDPSIGVSYGSWVLWPSPMFPPSDPMMQNQADDLLGRLQDALDPAHGGDMVYVAHMSAALSLLWARDPVKRQAIEATFPALFQATATPGTGHFGEVYVPIDTNGDGIPDAFENRVAVPISGGASLRYLTAMAFYDPEVFQEASRLPRLYCPQAVGCSASPELPTRGLALVFVAMLAGWLRLRPRSV